MRGSAIAGVYNAWVRGSTWLLIAPVLLAVACNGRDRAATDRCEPFDPDAVAAVLDHQREAWNAGDIDGFLAGYERSPALLFTSGAKVRRGFAETEAKFRARYGDDTETMGHLEFELLDVRPLGRCDEAAVVLGRWAVSESEQAGEGIFSVILERHDDGWKIVHDHTSAADPPNPADTLGPADSADSADASPR